MDYLKAETNSEKYTDEENSEVLSELQGSIMWSKRSLLYRISFLALLPLLAVFLLGFCSPFWMKKHQVDKYRGYYNIREKVDVSIGLWRVCEGTGFTDITDCTVLPELTNYILICQSMLCLCLIFTVFSLILGLYENCATRYDFDDGSDSRSKRPEMNAVLAGLFGLTGVSMYGTSIFDAARSGEGAVHWAFIVTAGAVTGLVVCGIIMAITNPVHSESHNFSGQVISLSRQSSFKSREPTVDDRLVASGDTVVPASSPLLSNTTYGITGSNFDIREIQFLQKSESSLNSGIPSLEIFKATSQEPGLPNIHKNTYVIETHDIHTHVRDPLRRLEIRNNKKRAQTHSWSSDDRSATSSSISDLVKYSSAVALPPEARSLSDTARIKASVSPKKGKESSPGKFKSSPRCQTPTGKINKTADLMGHEDLLAQTLTKGEQKSVQNLLSDLQRSKVSSGSWESQPWPEPPTDSEMLGQTLQAASPACSSNAAGSPSKYPPAQFKGLPESLLVQYQSSRSQIRNYFLSDDSDIYYSTQKPDNYYVKSSKGKQGKESQKPFSKKTSVAPKSVPVKQEYDNPLFRSQPPDEDKQGNSIDQFLPSLLTQPSSSPRYTAIDTMQSKSKAHRTYSTPIVSCPPTGEGRPTIPSHLTNAQSCEILPPAYGRVSKLKAEDTSIKIAVVLENQKGKTQQMNGDLNSQALQKVKQKAGRTYSDSVAMLKQQPTLNTERSKETSPRLASKLPKLSSSKPDSEAKERTRQGQSLPKGSKKAKVKEQHKQQSSSSSKQHRKI